jgi:hypothetical protein
VEKYVGGHHQGTIQWVVRPSVPEEGTPNTGLGYGTKNGHHESSLFFIVRKRFFEAECFHCDCVGWAAVGAQRAPRAGSIVFEHGGNRSHPTRGVQHLHDRIIAGNLVN